MYQFSITLDYAFHIHTHAPANSKLLSENQIFKFKFGLCSPQSEHLRWGGYFLELVCYLEAVAVVINGSRVVRNWSMPYFSKNFIRLSWNFLYIARQRLQSLNTFDRSEKTQYDKLKAIPKSKVKWMLLEAPYSITRLDTRNWPRLVET